jgi:hypothetical protein
MRKRKLKPDNAGGPTLRDVRIPIVEVACVLCDRRDLLERKALVAQFGAHASLARLRRRFAMGCERMCTPDGDKCATRFPCLD